MGLFGDDTERVNRANRNVTEIRRAGLHDWVPDEEATMNLTTFGGREEQRCAVVLHAISRLYGRCPIIAIHNSDLLEGCISQFEHLYPRVAESYPETLRGYTSSVNCNYDPLYGIDESSIVRCIYPAGAGDFALRAEGLRQYIKILKLNKIDLTLMNLERVCSMNLNRIEEELFPKIPKYEADDIMSVLMQNNLHLQVKADVKMFAERLSGKIWNREAKASGLNIVSAAKRNAVLSVKLTSNNTDVMNLLAAECNFLIDRGVHFLLIIDSIILENGALQDIIRNGSNQFAVVMAGPNHMDMLKGSKYGTVELPETLCRKTILFSCSNQGVAKFYSDMIGSYKMLDKTIADKAENMSGFSLFRKDESNISKANKDESRVRAEEIAALGDGALMMQTYENAGRRSSDIVIADYFEIPDLYALFR